MAKSSLSFDEVNLFCDPINEDVKDLKDMLRAYTFYSTMEDYKVYSNLTWYDERNSGCKALLGNVLSTLPDNPFGKAIYKNCDLEGSLTILDNDEEGWYLLYEDLKGRQEVIMDLHDDFFYEFKRKVAERQLLITKPCRENN